eukprot:766842-Hanusia_phi.AAC.10
MRASLDITRWEPTDREKLRGQGKPNVRRKRGKRGRRRGGDKVLLSNLSDGTITSEEVVQLFGSDLERKISASRKSISSLALPALTI